MALVKGTNSYATRAEADAYFGDRLNALAWNNATDAQKDQALISATAYLDTLAWSGYAVSDDQALAFPRVGIYFDPRVGADVVLQEDTVPNRIVVATYEMAIHLLNNTDYFDDTGSVEDIKVGSIELRKVRKSSSKPPTVQRFIQPLLDNTSLNTWWRAN
jgi:hypothetical protein